MVVSSDTVVLRSLRLHQLPCLPLLVLRLYGSDGVAGDLARDTAPS
ncbi:MAG TPA: hypothetical protein VE709_15990 [Pseudonocardiaceae bacterium]|nr:hypothetical protein [Pseudonocardiaceae bacterium]